MRTSDVANQDVTRETYYYQRSSAQLSVYSHQRFKAPSRSPFPLPSSSSSSFYSTSSSSLSPGNQSLGLYTTMPPLPPRHRQFPVRSPPRKETPRQPQHPPQLQAPWNFWESVAINISNVPKEASPLDIWQAFHNEGNIFSIDLFEDSHGKRETRGKIRFKYGAEILCH